MTSYIRAHWCGAQSLAWSFWVNLIALGVVGLVLGWFLQVSFIADRGLSLWLIGGFVGLLQLPALLWQIVGVIRAGDRYYSNAGAMEWVWASHAGIVFTLLAASLSLFGSMQRVLTNDDPAREIDAERLAIERASKYSFKIINIGTTGGAGALMRLEGSFELGITQKLQAFLARHPEIKGIVLSSEGGRIYEGRGIAALMKKHELTTYVLDHCNSACTTAFIGGKIRVLGAKSTIGFHQYWLDAQLQHPYIDLGEEQDKDRDFYRSQNISAQFLNRIFDVPHTGLWQPDHATLLNAGVVHKILPARREN